MNKKTKFNLALIIMTISLFFLIGTLINTFGNRHKIFMQIDRELEDYKNEYCFNEMKKHSCFNGFIVCDISLNCECNIWGCLN